MIDQASTARHAAWDVSHVDIAETMRVLEGMANSLIVRWGKELIGRLPARSESIEIGSGLGKLSLLLAMAGIRPTLFDSSSKALEQARYLFDAMELEAAFEVGDALQLPEEMRGKFDLSMSLGLNEHFRGLARQEIFDAHANVLRSGGWTLIGVPNRHCLSYRTAMFMWKLTGRWPQGLYEYGFSRRELGYRMERAGFKKISIVAGTYPVKDFERFIVGNLRAAGRKLMRMEKPHAARANVSKEAVYRAVERASAPEQLSSSQSYMWIAMGRRP